MDGPSQEVDLIYQDSQLGSHSEVTGGMPCMLLYRADAASRGASSPDDPHVFASLQSATEALQRQLCLDPPQLRSGFCIHILLQAVH